MTRPHADWVAELQARCDALHGTDCNRKEIVDANVEMIQRAIRGQGPDMGTPATELGARMAVNLAAVHLPRFCDPLPGDKAYKNGYDLNKLHVLGSAPAAAVEVRERVDHVLAGLTLTGADEIYFGAVELNGSGVRFYGDVCLVLKADKVAGKTVLLSSNSYDLVRPPVTPAKASPDPSIMGRHAQGMSGRWLDDLPEMAALKTFALRQVTERRLTTGQISGSVLDDEDYLELLRIGSFGAGDLQEARVAATDVSAEGQIGENQRLGPPPSLAEMQWRKHRRAASRALAGQGVRLRVVATQGRVR